MTTDNPHAAMVRRCGTCKRWRPKPKRDDAADRHYGACTSPVPAKIPAAYSYPERFDTAQSAGDNCPTWLAGGKHGALR